MGAATAIQPEAVTAAIQGNYEEAAKTTVAGAGFGAAVQQTLTKAPVLDKARVVSALGRAPGLLKFGGAAARFLAGPVGIGYTGLELIDAATKGITGKGIFEPSDKPVTDEDLEFSTM